MTKPFITIDDGTVALEWHKGKHELHLLIKDGQVEYIKVWGTNIDSEMDVGILTLDNFPKLWEWLQRGE